jgi:hypothetical protein
MKSKLLPTQDDLQCTLLVQLYPYSRSFSLTRYVDLAIHNGPRGMTLSFGEERPC